MRILCLSPHVPFPGIRHAGGAFLLHHLEALVAASHDVTLLVPGSPEVERTRALVPDWLDLVVAEPVDRAIDLRKQVDRVRALRRHRTIRSSSIRALRHGGLVALAAAADVVEVHWMELAVLVPELRRAGVRTPITVVAHDVHAESVPSRTRYTGTPYDRLQARLLEPLRRRADRADLRAADLVLVFKEDDERLLEELGVSTATQVISPDVVFPDEPPGPTAEPIVLFTGAMWRSENDLGARWFVDRVWPSVGAAVPEASFVIAGADPSVQLTDAVRRSPGVEVTGYVPSLLPYYATASVFVAPLFVAGGLKFKIAQAMAYGLPVVATTVAAAGYREGTNPAPLWAVTDDPAEMAQAIVGALTGPERSRAVGAAAARWSRERYSFEGSTSDVIASYERLITAS